VLRSKSSVPFDKFDPPPKNGAITVNLPEPSKYIKCEVSLRILHHQGSLNHDSFYNVRPVDMLQMLLHSGIRWITARSRGRKRKCRDITTKFVETNRTHLALTVNTCFKSPPFDSTIGKGYHVAEKHRTTFKNVAKKKEEDQSCIEGGSGLLNYNNLV